MLKWAKSLLTKSEPVPIEQSNFLIMVRSQSDTFSGEDGDFDELLDSLPDFDFYKKLTQGHEGQAAFLALHQTLCVYELFARRNNGMDWETRQQLKQNCEMFDYQWVDDETANWVKQRIHTAITTLSPAEQAHHDLVYKNREPDLSQPSSSVMNIQRGAGVVTYHTDYNDEKIRELTRLATMKHDTQDFDGAISLLFQARELMGEDLLNQGIAALLKLPLYLQKAGRLSDGLDECERLRQLVLLEYPDKTNPVDSATSVSSRYALWSKIDDKARLMCQRAKQYQLMAYYGIRAHALGCLESSQVELRGDLILKGHGQNLPEDHRLYFMAQALDAQDALAEDNHPDAWRFLVTKYCKEKSMQIHQNALESATQYFAKALDWDRLNQDTGFLLV